MEKKKSSLFQPVDSREAALKTIRDCSIAFLVVAAIQGGIGIFLMPGLLIDAFFLAMLAALLWWLKSRVVACILMLMATAIAITTVLSFLRIAELGGRNVWLAAIMFWAAVKSVEATFKLHGKYRTSEPTGAPYGGSAGGPPPPVT